MTDALRVGDIVLIDDNSKRISWPLGKVIELHPGHDGHVRTVTLRTKLGVKKRPVQRLVPLEISRYNDGLADISPNDGRQSPENS